MNNFKKNFIWNTLGSGLNAFNSLFFLIIVTRINGVNDAGIFTFSFATACLLYCIAIYSGRTYQVTEINNEIHDNDYIKNRYICSTLMIVIAFIFALINKYDQHKFIIFLLINLFKCLEALSDVFHGILQKNDKLDIVGKSLFIRSLLNIIFFILIDLITKSLILSCLSLIIVNIICLFFIDIRKSKKYIQSDESNKESIKLIFKLGFYTFGFTLIANYLVNAPRYALDNLLDSKFQTIFGIIVMPATIIMLINQFILQPVIVNLKELFKNNKKKEFMNLFKKIICLIIFMGFLAVICAYFLGIPVLNLLYGIKLNDYLINLILIIIGAILYAISIIISNILIIYRKTKMQLFNYIISAIVAYFSSIYLIKQFGFIGSSYSYLFTMFILLLSYIIYFIFVNKKIWNLKKDV